ncbi:MAG: sensor histidine kinase [Saprospiraceae bacterium]|mgnify:CR=1 FL=1
MQEYIELCSNKNEAKVAFLVSIMVGIIVNYNIPAENNFVRILIFVISIFITYACWYGNKVVSYWHNTIMPWGEKPIQKIFSVLALNGTFSIIVIAVSLYLFYLAIPSFTQIGIALKWGLIVGFLTSLFMNTFYTGVYFFDEWKSSLLETERLQKENALSQLNALRNQVNPHFLFNSLNTLTHLIQEDQSKATQFVSHFSDFYRYTLQSQEKEISTLKEELEAVDWYIQMQQERFGENLMIIKNVESQVNSMFLPTLTLQILIENCIKHNIISRNKPLKISIYNIENALIIENNFQPKTSKLPSTQLGLWNIQQRYSFLTKTKVVIKETSDIFMVNIPLLEAAKN